MISIQTGDPDVDGALNSFKPLVAGLFISSALGCSRTNLAGEEEPPPGLDAGWKWSPTAEVAFERIVELEAEGRHRTAFLAAEQLMSDFPGTIQAGLGQEKRDELLGLLWKEVHAGLWAFFTAERSYYQEHDIYSTDLLAIGFAPVGRPAYTFGFLIPCVSGVSGVCPSSVPECWLTTGLAGTGRFDPSEMVSFDAARVESVLEAKGLSATTNCSQCPTCNFNAVAVSSLNTNGGLDVWVLQADFSPGTTTIDHVYDDLFPDGGP